MKLPLWIRRLPHNLSTIRPRADVHLNAHHWAVGATLFLDTDPGDEDYVLHFDEAGLIVDFGPLQLVLYLVDTD